MLLYYVLHMYWMCTAYILHTYCLCGHPPVVMHVCCTDCTMYCTCTACVGTHLLSCIPACPCPHAGLERIFKSDPLSDASFFEGCQNPDPFKNLLFALAFFHCVVSGRRCGP